mmetsp:Transcript_44743/g.140297  ORF Transcript_44743/g.140297 Transcript_44743/m.140297 type:complete len:636 (-) Transcript_44743:141-2048(-)
MGASQSAPPKEDPEQDKGAKLEAPADFKGPVETRKCTDFLFTILLIVAWIAMTITGIRARIDGDLEALLNGMDYNGDICKGSTSKLMYVNTDLAGVCRSSCPDGDDVPDSLSDPDDLSSVSTSLTYAEVVAGTDWGAYTTCIEFTGSYTLSSAVTNNFCFPDYESRSILNRCIYTDEDIYSFIFGSGDFGLDYFLEFYADLYTARAIIFGFGFPVTVVLGFLFLFLLRIPGILPIVIWGSVFGGAAMLFALGIYSASKADEWDEEGGVPDYQVGLAKAFGYIFAICTIIYVCLCVYLRSRIALAIGLLKEAARAVASMPVLVFFPVIQAIGWVLFMIPWVFYCLFVASTGEVGSKEVEYNSQTIQIKTYNFDDDVQNQGWFLLFVFFWTTQFIVAFGQIVVAFAISSWYFTKDKGSIGNTTLYTAIKATTVFHTGTAAFGSLIIAIIQMIRAILAKLQKQAKDSKNKVAEYILCVCQCCMWCLENCMKFLNKNAYIQTAIFGTSFCASAKAAFFLILRNAARVFAVTAVGGFVILIGKVLIVGVACGGAYFLMDTIYGDQLTGLILPTLFVFISSWFVADMFLEIYGMAVSALLQCFVADEEMFPANQRFAENDLKKYFDKFGGGKKAEKDTPSV